ncbi:MAG: tetratricopeptide repeat protein [Thermoplasmata archaeon]
MGALGAISGTRKGNVAKLISEGNEHYRKGQLAEAITAYNHVLEIDPENPDAWNNKGLILAVAGNYKEALKCHLKAIELDPENVDAMSNVGMVHTKLESHKEALMWYDKALEMDRSHETTWNNKGNLLSKLGQYDEALKCYDRALEINPNYMAAMNNKAVELIHLKRYDEALDLLNAVLRSRPLFSEGWYVKGKAYVGMGEFDKAIICLERSHRLNPEFRQAKRALDILKSKLVQSPGEKVKGTGKKATRTRSENEKLEKAIQKEILKPRTETEMISDEFSRPEEHLTKEEGIALELLTDEYRPLAELKNAVGSRLTKSALEIALEDLEKKSLALSRTAGKAKEYARSQSLGTIEQELVEQREEQEPQDAGNDIHALVSRARRFIESERYSDAANSLRKALKINPYDDMAVCLLAQVQFEMGERDRAINTISKILGSKPDYIPAWFTLANASLKAKEYTDAAECYRKILELQPDNAEAKRGLENSESELKK